MDPKDADVMANSVDPDQTACLQFISNQCILDVSIIFGKPEVHPQFFSGK